MPRRKVSEVASKLPAKKKKVSRTKQSKKFSRLTSRSDEILLSTDLSGTSITHGHLPYKTSLADKTINKHKDQTQKLIIMTGVSLIMVIIIVAWAWNLKNTIDQEAFSVAADEPQTSVNFEQLKSDLKKTISEVKTDISDLESLSKEQITSTAVISETIKPEAEDFKTTTTISNSQSPNTLPN